MVGTIIELQPLHADELITIFIGIFGFGGTILGLYFAYGQLVDGQQTATETRQATQGQFLLQLSEHFRHFDAIHRSLIQERDDPMQRYRVSLLGSVLRKSWRPPGNDWMSVVQYMGLFERCKVLIDSGVLNLATFERQWGYRQRQLVSEAAVRERYFSATAEWERWSDFLELWKELDRAYTSRTGRRPEYPVTELPLPSGSGTQTNPR